MTYDPYTHASHLGMNIVYGSPGPNRYGLYNLHTHTATIRPGLTYRAERCTIAHEIVHHEYEDDITHDPIWHAKRERRCDRIAAGRLLQDVDPRTILGITDPAEWCRTLDVLPWVITTYLKDSPRVQTSARLA